MTKPTDKRKKAADTSEKRYVYKHQKGNLNGKLTIRELPWTEKQMNFLQIAQDASTKCMIVKGPAGTSKTLTSVYSCLKQLNEGKVTDIVYIRSAVESADSSLGFLPGDINEKFSVYEIPLMEKLSELLHDSQVATLQREGRIRAIPVGFLRGSHISCKAVIVEESQNFTAKELKTILTRIGEDCKVFIIGDADQSDLKGQRGGAFLKFYNTFANSTDVNFTDKAQKLGIRTFEFTEEDCMRSEFCKFILSVEF